jgi:hypothetical protein
LTDSRKDSKDLAFHRGPYKNGFEVFRSLIPTLTANPSAKISKATILIKVT